MTSAAIIVYQPPDGPLTAQEKAIVAGRNKVIEGYRDIAQALDVITKGRLYKQRGYETFEEYALKVWNYSDGRLYQFIAAEELAIKFIEAGLPPPPNEKVARGMVPLSDEQQRLIWSTAQKLAPNGKVTERWITALVTALEEVTRTRAINVDGEAVDVSQAFTVMVTDEAWYASQFQRGGMTGERLFYGNAVFVSGKGKSVTVQLEGELPPDVWGRNVRITVYTTE
jgi:ribosomal protein L35AE/L33A